MNRGFKFYFLEGIKKAVKTLFKRGNYLRFYIYSIMIFLLSITGIFIPVAKLARVRLGRIIKEHEDFDLPKVFAPSDNPLTVWNTVMALLLKTLLFLGGLILILLIAGIFFIIQLSLQFLIYGGMRNTFIFILFMIPPALLLIAYLVMYPIYLAPVIFCIDAIDKAKASETIYKSYQAVRLSGKLQLALNAICYYGPMILYIALTTGLSAFLFIYGDNEMKSFALILAIIFVAGFFVGAPILVLGCRVANTLLFEDIIIDRFNYENDVKGLYNKGTKSGKIDKTNYEGSLIRLFDETETASKEKDGKPLSKTETKTLQKQREQESKVIRSSQQQASKEAKKEDKPKEELKKETKEEEVVQDEVIIEEKKVSLPETKQVKEEIASPQEIIEEEKETIPEVQEEVAQLEEKEEPIQSEEISFVQEEASTSIGKEKIEEDKQDLPFTETKEEEKAEIPSLEEEEEKPFIFGNPFGSSLDDDEEEELIVDKNNSSKGKILFTDKEKNSIDEDEEELIAVTPRKRKTTKSNKGVE